MHLFLLRMRVVYQDYLMICLSFCFIANVVRAEDDEGMFIQIFVFI